MLGAMMASAWKTQSLSFRITYGGFLIRFTEDGNLVFYSLCVSAPTARKAILWCAPMNVTLRLPQIIIVITTMYPDYSRYWRYLVTPVLT